MSVLLLDRASVKKTWDSIAARIERRPKFEVVPEDAMNTIESVIMVNEDEAWDRWPTNSVEDQQCRVEFWKQCLIEALFDFAEEDGEDAPNVGLWAVYFHEYIAASLRGAEAAFDEDVIYSRVSVTPNIAQRALRDAYATCAAGLDGYTPEWNS